MVQPVKPMRKNPVLRTRQPTLPPTARSRAGLRLAAAASEGRLEFQKCRDCARFQYPPREACSNCLSTRLEWTECDGSGTLISATVLHHSNENYFRERVPVRVGLVRLKAGINIVAYVHGECAAPVDVCVEPRLDKAGLAAFVARPAGLSPDTAEEGVLRDMTSDTKFRKILVTDGKTATGQAIVRAMLDAGAETVWVGSAEPWKRSSFLDEIAALEKVAIVPLDVTDARSVTELAGLIGAKVDILVNTAEFHRNRPIGSHAVETARSEMEVNYLGLLRLIEAFGPMIKARAADGVANATAWVNILSIYALSALPSQATFTASKAAAFALSQSLRADMHHAGIRVLNVFPGPVEEDWNQQVPPPKLAPAALAAAIVDALRAGIEDLYPGEVAQDILARWRESAKVLERELQDE